MASAGSSHSQSGHRKACAARQRLGGVVSLFLLASASLLASVLAQDTDRATSSSIPGSSTFVLPTTTLALPVQATTSVYELRNLVTVQTNLSADSAEGATFHYTSTGSAGSTYLTVSVCDGPLIEAYNTSDNSVLQTLRASAQDARRRTLLRAYISSDPSNQSPSPSNPPQGQSGTAYLTGGYSEFLNTDRDPADFWLSVWPPEDTRNQTGTFVLQVVASEGLVPTSITTSDHIALDDTDAGNALMVTTGVSRLSPQGNATSFWSVVVLPTTKEAYNPALNSSWCAIQTAAAKVKDSDLVYNISQTIRGTFSPTPNITVARTQFHVSGLERATNYTAWVTQLIPVNSTLTSVLYPAIKFVTKKADNCRLVYDVSFCPDVAYSIPVGRDVETDDALDTIQKIVEPNFHNFSLTVGTFACGDAYFGQYSFLQSCDDCTAAYRDWLCAVSMPRCTDLVTTPNASAAVVNVKQLGGAKTPDNTALLPYIINRDGDSRASYIDDDLQAGSYGELLPCLSTCNYVTRACPPNVQWTCPIWDVTAQHDYGQYADSSGGFGFGKNGGAGSDGNRFGGPDRFVATDGFGNAYCNALYSRFYVVDVAEDADTTATSPYPSSAVILRTVSRGKILASLLVVTFIPLFAVSLLFP